MHLVISMEQWKSLEFVERITYFDVFFSIFVFFAQQKVPKMFRWKMFCKYIRVYEKNKASNSIEIIYLFNVLILVKEKLWTIGIIIGNRFSWTEIAISLNSRESRFTFSRFDPSGVLLGSRCAVGPFRICWFDLWLVPILLDCHC